MEYRVDTIVSDVQTCIDEIAANDAEWLLGQDAEEMDGIIKSKIYDAMRFVFLNADISLLDLEWSSGTGTIEGNKVNVSLLDTVLRICYARLDGWSRSLSDPILYSSKEYASLQNPITTGHPDNPKMAVTLQGTNRILELYGTDGESSYTLGYMPEPVKGHSIATETEAAYDYYTIPSKVYRGVIYYLGGLVLLTYKDAHADSLMNQALLMIGAK